MNDIVSAIKTLNKDDKIKYNRQVMSSVMEVLLNSTIQYARNYIETEELSELCNMTKYIIKETSSYDYENNPEFEKLFYLGYLKSIIDVKNAVEKTYRQKEVATKTLKRYKNLPNLLECLYGENSISHQELADRMNISKSNLSNFINNKNISDLVYKERYKKMVYYSISLKGQKMYKYIAETENKGASCEEYTGLFIRFLDCFQKEIDSDRVNYVRFFDDFLNIETSKMYFTKPVTIKNKLKKLIDTLAKQKAYSLYNTRVYSFEEIDLIEKKKEKQKEKYLFIKRGASEYDE